MTEPFKARAVNLNHKLRNHYLFLLVALFAGAFLYGPSLENMPTGQWIASCLVVGLFTAIPLLCFVLTALKPTPAGVSWMSFLLLGYLVFGILLIFNPNALVAGLLITSTSLSTFIFAILWLRPHKKAAKAKQKAKAE